MTYEDFFSTEDVAAYKRVKTGTMKLAREARRIIADMVGAEYEPTGKAKEFLRTERGLFRLSMSPNSDNTTEIAAHQKLGASKIVMSDDRELHRFFRAHGLGFGALEVFKERLARRMQR